MKPRGKWQGMLTIARLNWPFYVAAVAVALGASWMCVQVSNSPLRWLFVLVLVGCLYFLIGSLSASHWVYDRSDLYQWKLLERALGTAPRGRMLFCHSGFDEASEALREHLHCREWLVLDHYDAAKMSEPSIRRARALFPPITGTLHAPFDHWPVPSETVDVIFGLLAIHELRSDAERAAWFAEAKRCLQPRGRIVLVEHARNPANFLAFGPGFLHFHSPASWRRSWERAGLRALDEFRVTALVRVFVVVAHE